MTTDNLFAVLAKIRADVPEIDDPTMEKLKRLLGAEVGGSRVYVPSRPKKMHLERLEAADANATTADLARLLGVSTSRIRQLKRLKTAIR